MSNRSWRPVLDEMAQFVDEHLGRDDGIVVVDESGVRRWGDKSAGIARQSIGNVGNVHNGQVGVYLTYASEPGQAFLDMRLYIPRKKARLARKSDRSVPGVELAARLGERDWQRLTVAEGAKGRRVFDFAFLRGVAKRGGLPGRDAWLMVRRSLDQTPEIKDSLSNAPADVDPEGMAVVGSERWRVESAIKEAKSQTGLDQSEGRNWKHWHHHTTLSMLAQAFLTCARVTGAKNLSQKGSFGR